MYKKVLSLVVERLIMETHRLNLDIPTDTHRALKESAQELGIPVKGLICMAAISLRDIPATKMIEALGSVRKFSTPKKSETRQEAIPIAQ